MNEQAKRHVPNASQLGFHRRLITAIGIAILWPAILSIIAFAFGLVFSHTKLVLLAFFLPPAVVFPPLIIFIRLLPDSLFVPKPRARSHALRLLIYAEIMSILVAWSCAAIMNRFAEEARQLKGVQQQLKSLNKARPHQQLDCPGPGNLDNRSVREGGEWGQADLRR